MIKQLLLLITIFVTSCGGGSATNEKTPGISPFVQTLNLKVDNKLYQFSHNIDNEPDDVIISTFHDGSFSFSVTSQRQDLQFSFTANLGTLTKGLTAKAYTCHRPSACIDEEDVRGHSVVLGKFPDGKAPALSETRSAYKAPDLGLAPLNITITDVTDEQMPGARKTKLVKGTFNGVLAYVEQDKTNRWYVKATTKVEGDFYLYCQIY